MATAGQLSHSVKVPFGAEMRKEHFTFSEDYHPLNHGSFGASPKAVLEYQRQLQLECEARPDTFIRFTYPKLLKKSREAVAPLLGADPGEVVLVPNTTTGANTVLRNIPFVQDDVIIHFNTVYLGCGKTIQSLSETTPVTSHQIEITYPIEDDEIVRRFTAAIHDVRAQGKRPKLAMFDIVLTLPGVKFPWEPLVAVCKDLGVMSFIDGAHGVGHVDLTHVSEVGPDFLISNCHKWLMVPRGCAVLYVPFRNQHLIATTIPTSGGFEAEEARKAKEPQDYFSRLFGRVSTTDVTNFCCVPIALQFRSEVCGGEASIREYCEEIAHRGGERMAEILGTEVLGSPSSSFRRCCMVNIRLPLTPSDLGIDGSGGGAAKVATWVEELCAREFDTFITTKFYAGAFWCRLSAQIYLTVEDFEWAATTLMRICERAKVGECK